MLHRTGARGNMHMHPIYIHTPTRALVQVDTFDKHGPLEQEEGYVRPAIVATENWDLAAGEPRQFKAAA